MFHPFLLHFGKYTQLVGHKIYLLFGLFIGKSWLFSQT